MLTCLAQDANKIALAGSRKKRHLFETIVRIDKTWGHIFTIIGFTTTFAIQQKRIDPEWNLKMLYLETHTHMNIYIYMYIHTCYRDINIHTYTHLLYIYIYITIIGKHNYLTPNIYNQNRRLKVFITSTPTWDFIFAIFKKPGQDTAARNYQPGKKCKVFSVSALRPS